MEALMLLLGTSPLQKVPPWLKSICGRCLTKVLLRPNGVATVLEFMVGDADTLQLDHLEKISKLVLTQPAQINSVEVCWSAIPSFSLSHTH